MVEQRRLAAILAADMVGYSRLMEADESGTITRQKSHRTELIDLKIAEYKGRIVKTTGDGLLVEFASVVDAVNCAIEIQTAMVERELDVSHDLRIQYRIGINLGDIIVDGDDILGDGVNVAARLESIAPSSGICVSELVWQNLRGGLGDNFSFTGEQRLKNIDRNIAVWQWPADASEKTATPTDNKKSTANRERSIEVLPFAVFPDEAAFNVYSVGLDDDIARALTKLGALRVVTGNHQTGTIDFTIRGTMRIVETRIRCTLQLIDNKKQRTLWSEKFDGTTKKVFDLQDQIVEQVSSICEIELSEGQQASIWRQEANHALAYEYFLAGRAAYKEYTRSGIARARNEFEAAIQLSPTFHTAIVGLARTHIEDVTFGWSNDSEESLRKARGYLDKVFAIEPNHPAAHAELSHLLLRAGEYQTARLESELAIALDPNSADAYAVHAFCLNSIDLPEEALHSARRAINLNPGTPEYYALAMVDALLVLGRFEEALVTSDQVLSRRPSWITAKIWRALALDSLGKANEARQQITELLESSPRFSAQRWRQIHLAPKRASLLAFEDRLVELGLTRKTIV